MGLRVGLLGGTFDPPHCGHLAASRAASQSLRLDRLLLVVANEPWQKVPRRAVTPPEDRLAMVEAMLASVTPPIPGVEASRLEIDRGGPSYTADTVDGIDARAVARGEELPQLYLIVGADLVGALPTWKRVDDLQRRVTLAIVSRPQSALRAAPAGWRTVEVHAEAVDVSSSEIRERLERGCPVDGMVPEAVIRCIRRRNLYAVTR